MKANFLRVLLLCGVLFAARCSNSGDTIAGGDPGGTVVGNPVYGMVYDSTNTPIVGAIVRIRSANYLTSIPQQMALAKERVVTADTVTGADGKFSFSAVDNGSYFIEIMVDSAHGVLIPCTTGIGSDTVRLSKSYISPYAVLRGNVDSIVVSSSNDNYIRVRGLERVVQADSNGQFNVRVPASQAYTVNINNTSAQSGAVELKVKNVSAGDLIVIDTIKAVAVNAELAAWRYRTKVTINTGVNGAQFGYNVYNFPLLVTIPASWPLYNQVNGSVGDIRFVKPDGTMLPYEIERWDSGGAGSALWVTVDTIRRNSSDQFIYMYWGNETARSIVKPVFSRQNGHLTVWHGISKTGTANLTFAQSGTAGSDAVATSTVTVVPGLIGDAIRFNGINDSLTASLDLDSGITDHEFSCWIKVADSQKTFSLFTGTLNATTQNQFGIYSLFRDQISYLSTSGSIGTKNELPFEATNSVQWIGERWYHIMISTYGKNRGKVYVNGFQLDLSSYGRFTDALKELRLTIGGSQRAGFFNGIMDEIRISTKGSENHYFLSYLNQKPGQELVSLGVIERLE